MALTTWDQADDDYNYEQLANNWNVVAYHDHTPGNGRPVGPGGIADGAVSLSNLNFLPVEASQGLLDNRPETAGLGREYFATDASGIIYIWNGSIWAVVPLFGAWSALGFQGGLSAQPGVYVPSARLEGDVVRLKGGAIKSVTSGVGAALRLPSGMAPTELITLTLTISLSGGGLTEIGAAVDTSGYISMVGGMALNDSVYLDDHTFTLS